MIREEFELKLAANIEDARQYFCNPENILKYVKQFREIKQLDNELYLVKLRWLISLDFKVTRNIISSPNSAIITYKVVHEGFPKIDGTLEHIITKNSRENCTIVKIIFIYNGPFSTIARRESKIIFERVTKEIMNDFINKVQYS
ncbi:MAG: hypothetical protein QXH75_01095 [Sulfolobaceae archaeon]